MISSEMLRRNILNDTCVRQQWANFVIISKSIIRIWKLKRFKLEWDEILDNEHRMTSVLNLLCRHWGYYNDDTKLPIMTFLDITYIRSSVMMCSVTIQQFIIMTETYI